MAASTSAIETNSGCPWTIAGTPTWITVSSGALSGAGPGTVTLGAGVNTNAARSATLNVAGFPIQVSQDIVPLPSIQAAGVVNAASSIPFDAVAPGSIATVYGNFLVSGIVSAAGAPLPKTLAGLSLQFGNGVKAPLFAVAPGQVNFQVPWELAGQSQTTISGALNGLMGTSQPVRLAVSAPGIFTVNARGTGRGAVLDSAYHLVDASNPAVAGSTVLQIYCTGLGAVTNPPASGDPALNDPLSRTIETPDVSIGACRPRCLSPVLRLER